ncbi:MAG: hypothetical protein RLZZ437_2022 [Pseudomonadota bacterium]
MWESLVLAAGLGATAILSVIGGLIILTMLQKPKHGGRHTSIFREGPEATIFLFDGEDLVDATPSAYRLLSGSGFTDKPWFALMERLSGRFENLEGRLSEAAMSGSVVLAGLPKPGAQAVSLRAELRGGLMKIALVTPGREADGHHADILTVQALDHELQDLRAASNSAPFPMWRTQKDGEITWANAAYIEAAAQLPRQPEVADWPFRALFDLAPAKGDARDKPLRRKDLAGKGWFDVTTRPVGDGKLSYALPAGATVIAEGALQDFKQTLTTTFAELATGLAVFDHNRKLQLFNPALAQLIEIPVEVLLKRPALFAMLDAMRDRNMLPEPKDYKSWRHQMVDLEAAALRGDYKETWHLPNGKAFRVVGRPYPNGALALMVDDITDQVTRDRLFRSELDMVVSIINQMDEAVVAFPALGKPVFANSRYHKMWGHDPKAIAKDGGVIAVLEAWRAQSVPGLVWSEIEAALDGGPIPGEPQLFTLNDGRPLSCRMMALPGGGIGVLFRQHDVGDAAFGAAFGMAAPAALSA